MLRALEFLRPLCDLELEKDLIFNESVCFVLCFHMLHAKELFRRMMGMVELNGIRRRKLIAMIWVLGTCHVFMYSWYMRFRNVCEF